MFSLYQTLSLRYLRRRWFRALLIVASIALGVATLVATRALNETMTRAGLAATNPMTGLADLMVSNGDSPVSRSLADELAQVEGVRSVRPLIFANLKLPDLENRSALLVGSDLKFTGEEVGGGESYEVTPDPLGWAWALGNRLPLAVLGKELRAALGVGARELRVLPPDQKEPVTLGIVGTVDAHGAMAALGGNSVALGLDDAAQVLRLRPDQVTRLDLALAPGADRDKVKAAVAARLAKRAEVHTPDEQMDQARNAMSGMQTGFSLCGLAALVVGLFLVYNALSVTVAERRHEIGILLALGATRGQVQRLFAGEAALLGLAGSVAGIPLGAGLAYLALGLMQEVIRDIFMNVEADRVELSPGLLLAAIVTGVLTAVIAAVVPAIVASGDNPAEAVRRIPRPATWGFRAAQVVASALLIAVGTVCILVRGYLPFRLGTYGGLVLVLLGALLATPLLAAAAARGLQPFFRLLFGIEGRLAADNLVRAPARTGLVIAALAAGVALVMQTAGTVRSNREALRSWVENSIGADLIVTSGSPFGAGGQNRAMGPEPDELCALGASTVGLMGSSLGLAPGLAVSALPPGRIELGPEIEALPGVQKAMPLRFRKHPYRDTQVYMIAFNAGEFLKFTPRRQSPALPLYRALGAQEDGAIISENFAALHGVHTGDTVTLASRFGPVRLRVLGEVVDYSWNHGTILVNRKDYLRHWEDPKVDVYDVYLEGGADDRACRETILRRFGAQHGLVVQTREELQSNIDRIIERLYGIAYGQQVVVMFVAALGVVTALLISVLQRRREMGLLRAIGASQAQVVYSVLAEAALMGVIGTAIGLLVGVPLEWYVLQVVILEESGYLFAVQIPWVEALVIAGAALGLATVAGLGPALYAVRQRIPEAIAYE